MLKIDNIVIIYELLIISLAQINYISLKIGICNLDENEAAVNPL